MDLELINGLAGTMGHEMLTVLQFPLDANKRIFAGYLLSALVLASVVYLWQQRTTGRASLRGLGRYLFNPRVWWHPSARVDYLLLLINPLIRLVLASAVVVSSVSIALLIANSMGDQFGHADTNLSPWAITALFTVALFIADDFTRYGLHWLAHRIPALWALHKLHHSAEVMTPATVYRMHPLESLLFAIRMVITQGVVLGVFFYGFGMRLSAWDVAGVNLFMFLFNMSGANLRHSHVWLSYGPWLERIFISPAQHQIHHSRKPEHCHSNYGSCLAIWDGLFGTLTLARGQRVHAFGVARRNPHPTLWSAYWVPVVELLRALSPQGLIRRGSAKRPTRLAS